MNNGKYGLCLVRSGCMVRSYFQGKAVLGKAIKGEAFVPDPGKGEALGFIII